MDNNIFEKIEKITITPLQSLPIEDKTFCEQVNVLFLEALTHYELMLTKVKELLPIEQKSGVVDKRYYNQVIDLSTSNYSINTTIEAFEKSISKAKHNFAYTIAKHFENKYNVVLIDNHYNVIGLKETDCTLECIVSVIVGRLNGKTFNEMGKITLLNQFKEALKHKEISISGTSIHIRACVNPNESVYHTGEYYITGTDKERLMLILKTISLYELGCIDNLTGILDKPQVGYLHFNVGTHYETTLEKVKSIYFYQNGKLTIKLTDKQSANELYNLINYGTI